MIIRIVFLVLISIIVSGCSSALKHKQYDASENPHELVRSGIWVSSDYKKENIALNDISIFVRHLRIRRSYAEPIGPNNEIERDVADYFVIVNSAANDNNLTMLNPNLKSVKVLESSDELIQDTEFKTETSVFNSVNAEKGAYYQLIAKGRYSPPDCGLLKKYTSQSGNLSVSFIDAVSCGQLTLEVSSKKYKAQFKERLGNFKSRVAQSFGVIN